MNANDLVPTLMIFTLAAGLVIALVLFIRFMRKPKNRHSMDGQRERSVDEMRDEASRDQGPRG